MNKDETTQFQGPHQQAYRLNTRNRKIVFMFISAMEKKNIKLHKKSRGTM